MALSPKQHKEQFKRNREANLAAIEKAIDENLCQLNGDVITIPFPVGYYGLDDGVRAALLDKYRALGWTVKERKGGAFSVLVFNGEGE